MCENLVAKVPNHEMMSSTYAKKKESNYFQMIEGEVATAFIVAA